MELVKGQTLLAYCDSHRLNLRQHALAETYAAAGEKKYAEAEPLLVESYQGMLARKDRIAAPDQYHLELAHRWLVQLYKGGGKPVPSAHR